MNSISFDQKIKLLLYHLGEPFLQYVLNYTNVIDRDTVISQFSSVQLETIDALIHITNNCIEKRSFNPHSTTLQYFYNYRIAFAALRSHCLDFEEKYDYDCQDSLINYLIQKGIEYYPCLLIIEEKMWYHSPVSVQSMYYDMSLEEMEYVIRLLKNHSVLGSFIQTEDFHQIIEIKYNDVSTYTQVWFFIERILLKSFQICCYETDFSVQSFVNQIKAQLNFLIQSVQGSKVKVRMFSGIYGLRILESDCVEINPYTRVRNINNLHNPCLANSGTMSIANIGDSDSYILGAVLECDYGFTGDENNSIESINAKQEFIIKYLKISIILTVASNSNPFSTTFLDSSIPFLQFSQSINYLKTGCVTLNSVQVIEWVNWFELLTIANTDSDVSIELAINRIIKSIDSNSGVIDSLIDLFIAWECMFSSDISTTNSVVNSIHKMLELSNCSRSKKMIDSLYKLRCKIVHGGFVFDSREDYYTMRREVIEITLIVFRQLLKLPELRRMTPKQRVESLLQPEKKHCEHCGSNRFLFN